MKVGILGSGVVGQALGAGFASLGHDVKMGTRDPQNEKVKEWVRKTGPRASSGAFAAAAAFGDVVVLATLWSGTENAVKLADAKNLRGKILIDVTNPLKFLPNQAPSLAVGHSDSGGEHVQRWLPETRVVKAFNIITSAAMVNPKFAGGPPDMFICGNDAAAKQTVTDICHAFGWPVVDIGGIEGSRLLEPLAMLWVTYGFRTNSWTHAFKLLRQPEGPVRAGRPA